jgi:hypothetical protein
MELKTFCQEISYAENTAFLAEPGMVIAKEVRKKIMM